MSGLFIKPLLEKGAMLKAIHETDCALIFLYRPYHPDSLWNGDWLWSLDLTWYLDELWRIVVGGRFV